MNQLEPFKHQESFEHLITGDDILETALDKRAEALKITTEILQKMEQLNTVLQRPCTINKTANVPLVYELIDSVSYYGDTFMDHLPKINKRMDSKFWNSIVDNSSITSVMHTEMKEKFQKTISEKPPEFTREHIYGTLNHYMENRFTIFVEGALNLFKKLNKDFKTNDGIKVRQKLIFGSALGAYGWCMYGHSRNLIEDLERIFYVLDGIDPTKRPYGEWATNRIERSSRGEEYQFEYFRVRTFKNGNIHLWMTREDLVEKLNTMIADHFGESLGHRTGKRN